jgi:hypothetical protein
MSRFLRNFAIWFLILMTFFVLANLVGFIKDEGDPRCLYIGFPWSFELWDLGNEWAVYRKVVIWNGSFALAVSIPVALLCAFTRTRYWRAVDG